MWLGWRACSRAKVASENTGTLRALLSILLTAMLLIEPQIFIGIPRPARSYTQRPGRKPMWCVAVHGAHAIAWMMTLYTFMGQRRSARIRELIQRWTSYKGRRYTTKGMRVMATCHPERRAHALMLCRYCYNKQNVERYKKDPAWRARQRQRKRGWEAKQRAAA